MTAIDEIAAERRRQIETEGWTPEHDDTHWLGQLSIAASCYALHSGDDESVRATRHVPHEWPWTQEWWKPTTARRDLIKAAALIVAEIERLDRRESSI